MPKRTQGLPIRRTRTWFSAPSVMILEAVDRPPFLLGRAPATGIALSGSRIGLARRRDGGEVLAQQPRRIGVAAALGKTRHLQDPHHPVERDRDDIAGP